MTHRWQCRCMKLGCAVILAGSLGGCATVGPLPAADLSDPAWTVWSGQALWKPEADRPPLAGEILLARNLDGDVFVSFSKSLLPIFTAQTAGALWRIDFAERGRCRAGRGQPPRQFVWFQLPELLQGAPPPDDWSLQTKEPNKWVLSNDHKGEQITLLLDE